MGRRMAFMAQDPNCYFIPPEAGNQLATHLELALGGTALRYGQGYGVPPARDTGRSGEWSVTVNYGLMLTSGAKTKVTTRFLVKNYPYDMFGRYSRYRVVT